MAVVMAPDGPTKRVTMKGGRLTMPVAESGWYHGARRAFVPGCPREEGFFFRSLKISSSRVLGRESRSTYRRGYASRSALPAALLEEILSDLSG